jgi:Bacterial surface proteins containing Ig-like domains
MKKIIYLTLALTLLNTMGMRAQVMIGEDKDPHSGAMLELRADTKGLLLPRVALQDVSVFTLDEVGTDTATTANGMVVYNTNPDIIGGKGIGTYVWDGVKWMLIGETDVSPAIVYVTGITISGPTIVDVGSTIELTVSVKPDNASNKNVIWTVSNNLPSETGRGAATISPMSGRLTGTQPGIVYVYATATDGGGAQDVYEVMVMAVPVTSIDILGNTAVAEGSSISQYAEVLPDNATNKSVRWFVTNGTGSANIDMQTGTLTGVSAGTVTVRVDAQDGSGVSKEKEINVESNNVLVTGITIMGGTEVNSGETLQLAVDILPADATNKSVTWSVVNGTGTATINSATGLLTGGSGGTVTVRADAEDGSGIHATHNVEVIETTPPGTVGIPAGIYTPNYGQYFPQSYDGYDATEIQPYFDATNETLYLYTTNQTGEVTWATARNACNDINKRLPNLYELAQLQDDYAHYGLNNHYYWSSTLGTANSAWVWDFWDGHAYWGLADNQYKAFVRCVWHE